MHRLIAPHQALAELGQIRLADVDLAGVLAKVAELIRDSLENASEVSVTLVRGGRGHTGAYTGETAIALDETQYEGGHGPCLAAAASAGTLYIADMRTETRWPAFTPRAIEQGVASSLAVGVSVHGTVLAALNIYSTTLDAFDDEDVRVAEDFACYAAVALANADSYDGAATLADQLRGAMAGRAVIEQAKGIVMATRHCGADEAFTVLARTSQDTNRKLRDVAADLVADMQQARNAPTHNGHE